MSKSTKQKPRASRLHKYEESRYEQITYTNTSLLIALDGAPPAQASTRLRQRRETRWSHGFLVRMLRRAHAREANRKVPLNQEDRYVRHEVCSPWIAVNMMRLSKLPGTCSGEDCRRLEKAGVDPGAGLMWTCRFMCTPCPCSQQL